MQVFGTRLNFTHLHAPDDSTAGVSPALRYFVSMYRSMRRHGLSPAPDRTGAASLCKAQFEQRLAKQKIRQQEGATARTVMTELWPANMALQVQQDNEMHVVMRQEHASPMRHSQHTK